MIALLLSLSTAPPTTVEPAQPVEHLWVKANEAYDTGAFDQAAALYDELRRRGLGDGYVSYNAGNAHLRAGRLGRAVAAYLQARAALPRDSDIAANLSYARQTTKDALAPPEPHAALRTLFFWHYWLSLRELLLFAVLANLLLWSCLALWRLRRWPEVNRWLAGVALVLVIATGTSAAIRLFSPRRVAVVLKQEVDVRSGLSEETVVRFQLHEGSELRVIERTGKWVRIALPDGNQGWVPRPSVALLAL